ncbi:MAG: formyltransferase/hydrolase complex subunit epsilon (fhcD) [candidate division NC10 bacterium CSP1-5]|nr:MAG: formyltransferase/hydrolase complex subunit epsilon (fhcD) [candidate division NC10 bacterium CSP1-5]
MELNGVPIEDTYAEAFSAIGARLLITAENERWAREAAASFTGFATSVIGSGCEAGVEGVASETPDGRPGVTVLIFAMSKKGLHEQLIKRIGQSVMTCPSTACYNALAGESWVSVGGKLRFFGDGFQSSKLLDGVFNPPVGRARRFWRIPVMDGEFVVEDRFGMVKGVAGGNFLLLGEEPQAVLQAAELAVGAMRQVPGVILPFPGGVVRSGSKVGSQYKFLTASTNTAYCPTIRRQVESVLPDEVRAVLEIVIDGLTPDGVAEAMRVGIRAACRPGIKGISAGNYGGKLGKYHFRLHEVLRS